LNDYGIKPTSILFIALEEGYYPKDTDIYNPDLPNFGNSNYGKNEARTELFWDGTTDSYLDLRLFYVFRDRNMWSKCRWDPSDTSYPDYWIKSHVTDT
jgi:hypothetical protein